jgi:hypothetical protein
MRVGWTARIIQGLEAAAVCDGQIPSLPLTLLTFSQDKWAGIEKAMRRNSAFTSALYVKSPIQRRQLKPAPPTLKESTPWINLHSH